jgi:hypothetical protein
MLNHNHPAKTDIPCTCGHPSDVHRGYDPYHCWSFGCFCDAYVPDKLKYLEKQYDIRNSN